LRLRQVQVIDHQDQLIVVIAVLHFDVHAGIGESTRELSQLPGLTLTKPRDEHVARGEDADARGFEYVARDSAVGEQKVRDTAPHAASFNTHAGSPESFAHFRERSGPVFESDSQILHDADPNGIDAVDTSIRIEVS
jgi:hypothetical protein